MREYETISIFDLLPADDEMYIKYASKKSTDWKWNMSQDYPQKNGLKVFSCFACGGAVPWAINLLAVTFSDVAKSIQL